MITRMSIALGNMYAKFWKPLCMKFVRLGIDSRVLLYPEEGESIFFSCRSCTVRRSCNPFGKVKEFSHNYKIS